MSVRLWPDIIVSMEIYAHILAIKREKGEFNPNAVGKDLLIDIKDCIDLQERCWNGRTDVFVSQIGSIKHWDDEDYVKYINHINQNHPGWFMQLDKTTIYKFNCQEFFKDIDIKDDLFKNVNKLKHSIRNKLLTEGSYNGITMAGLGLL